MSQPTLAQLRAATYKRPDAWWTVLLVDPLAVRLVRWSLPRRWITPNRVTLAAFGLAVGAAACFLAADRGWLVAGALLYHLSFVLDCVDGKLARWQGSGSVFGSWLDYIVDRLRELICTVALTGGQYLATGQGVYLLLGILIIFLDMFRYLDALHMDNVRRQMREALRAAGVGTAAVGGLAAEPVPAASAPAATADVAGFPGGLAPGPGPAAAAEARTSAGPAPAPAAGPAASAEPSFDQSWRRNFSAIVRFRAWCERRRIRPHLISGIEFQMAVFIIGPLLGAVLGVTLVAIALILPFELAMVFKFWLSTKDFDRQLAAARARA